MEIDNDGVGLGQTAEDFYNEWSPQRLGAETRARRLADLTIPSVFPPEGWESSQDDLETTNQSVNAFCTNTLGNKLTLAALPPSLPMAKYTPIETRIGEDIKADPELWGETLYALSRREENHRARLETTLGRDTYGQAMRLLLTTGNCCTIWTDIDKPRTYNLNYYVCVRDAAGTPLATVLKDSVPYAVADDDVKQAAEANWARAGKKPGRGWGDKIDIFHCQKLIRHDDGEKEWVYWQEVEGGQVVSGTEAYSPEDVPPMMPAELIHVTGSHWGLPYALDYEGDLQAVENFAASLQDGAAALAWFLLFVNPTGQTNIKDVQEADTLDVLPGRAEDVSALQTLKTGDLSVVAQEFEKASRRLGFAYAQSTSIQRSGERVTAEEWEKMAQELDTSMGGLYTTLSRGYQRWFVLRFIHLHELEDKDMKPLPEGIVRVGVVTGLDNIGSSTEHQNLIAWAKEGNEVLGPEQFQGSLNAGGFLKRTAAARAVKVEGLLKTEDQKQAEQQAAQQQQQQQTVLDKATGPMAQGGADMIAQMMQQQQGAQQPNG